MKHCHIQRQVAKLVKDDKCKTLKQIYKYNANNMAKLWSETWQALSHPPTTAPTKHLHNTKIETKPSKIAELLNDTYIEKPDKMRANMGPTRDPMPHYKCIIHTPNEKLTFIHITEAETQMVFSNMKPTKLTTHY